jgi:phage terminase large subunit GpA-like protein
VFGYPQTWDDGGLLFVAAGVDVQKNRIEVEVDGWGEDRQSWSIDYHVIDGDVETQTPWDRLDALLARDWPHASGALLPIRVLCVDAGYATTAVIRWARRHPRPAVGPAGASARQPRTVVPVVGRDRYGGIITGWSNEEATRRRHRLRIATVGGPVAKGELYRQLQLDPPTDAERAEGKGFPPGYCHFPQYGEEYFKQLTSERLVTHMVRGFPRGVWEKDPGVRNETLDARVYARAAAAIFGLDRFQGAKWAELAAMVAGPVPDESAAAADDGPASAPTEPQRPNPAEPPRRGGGMGGWLDRGRGGWLRR